jgi:hypothetical protein
MTPNSTVVLQDRASPNGSIKMPVFSSRVVNGEVNAVYSSSVRVNKGVVVLLGRCMWIGMG